MNFKKILVLCIVTIFVSLIPQVMEGKEEATEKEVMIVPIFFPKSGSVTNNYQAAEIREKYERNWQEFWTEESYGKFRANVRSYGYLNLPWPKDPGPNTGISGAGDNSGEVFNENPDTGGGAMYGGSPIRDGFWTPGERFRDNDGNGSYTTMDPFWDTYGTTEGGSEHNYDEFGEEFVDWDNNVEYTTIDGLNPTGNVLLLVYDETLDSGRGPDSSIFGGVSDDGIVGSPLPQFYIAAGNIEKPYPTQWAERVLSVNELDLNMNDYFSKLTTQTVNDYSGEVNFLVTAGNAAFDLGDSFTIRTTGRVLYSEAIWLIDGDTVPVNPNAPSLKTSLISGMTKEKGGEASFSIRLNSKPTDDVVIHVSSGDSSEGKVNNSTLYFSTAKWNVDQIVTVIGLDDEITDGDIPYLINFTVSSVDSDYNNLDNIKPVNVVNKDDEIFGISITPPVGLTHEHGSTTTFDVVINSEPNALVRVSITSEDVGEGVVSPAYLDFSVDNWSAPQSFSVTGQDDGLVDANITYMIILNSTSEDNNFSEMIMTAKVTNVDDEIGAVTVGEVTGNTDESGRTSEFIVVLTTEPTQSVSFTLISETTSEGTVSPSIITFTTLSWNTLQTVTVTGVDDLTADGDQAYRIITGVAQSEDVNFNGLIISDVLMVNEDDDSAGLTVSKVEGIVSEEGLTATFSVKLNTQPSAEVTLPLSVNDFTEASLSKSELTFNDSNWSGTQVVTVTGLDDIFVDGHVPFKVQLNPLVSGDGNYNGIDPADIELLNLDNDSAKVVVGEISGPTSEDGDQARFSMVLSSQPSADVTINMISSSTEEGILVNDSVVFTENDWNIPQSVVIRGVDDNVQDGHIAYQIITAAVVSADSFYSGLEVDDVTVVNLDSLSAYIRVSKVSGTVSEEGNESIFKVSLTSEPGSDVKIAIVLSDSTEASVSTSELVFTPVNYQGAQVVTVTGLDDALLDGDIPFRVALEPAVSGDSNYNKMDASDVFMTNLDNDQAGFKITAISSFTTEDGGEATYKVSLFTQPANNVAFTLASSDTTEGTVSPQTMNFSSATWNIPLTVTVTGVNDIMMDGDVTYEILMSTASSEDEDYSGMNVNDVTALNIDNNSPGVIITDLESSLGRVNK